MGKKNVSPLGDRNIDDEEKPEQVITGSSSDDEVFLGLNCFLIVCSRLSTACSVSIFQANYGNLNLANPEMKGQSVADRFQEALAATSLSNDGALVTAAKLSG